MEKKFYTAKEAAETMNISSKMIYKLVQQNQIPYTKIGSKVLIPIDNLNSWIDSRMHQNP